MTAGLLLDVARSQLGVTESPPNSNHNPFGVEVGNDGQPWCASFVTWCWRHAGLTPLPDVGNGGPNRFTFCPSAVNYARTHDQAVGDPKPGDIVLYDWEGDGTSDHVGLIEDVLPDGRLKTIEGNTSPDDRGSQSDGGGVFRKVRDRSRVICIWRPPVDSLAGPKNRPLPEEDDLAMLEFPIRALPSGLWVKVLPVDGGHKLTLVGSRWAESPAPGAPADAIVEWPQGVFTMDVGKMLARADGLRGDVRVGPIPGGVLVSDADGDYGWHAA